MTPAGPAGRLQAPAAAISLVIINDFKFLVPLMPREYLARSGLLDSDYGLPNIPVRQIFLPC
jgi:hypothetical protein